MNLIDAETFTFALGTAGENLDCSNEAGVSKPNLENVSTWFCMIDVNLEMDMDMDMVEQITASDYDMVVLGFIPSEANNTDFPMASVVAELRNAPRPKLVMAHIDSGQAAIVLGKNSRPTLRVSC